MIRKALRESGALRVCALLLSSSLLCLGCTTQQDTIRPETQYVVVDRPARIPPGVVRYCWEEPMVQYEPQGPGLNEEKTWYAPAHMEIREVRMGRWRPCQPVPSEVKGDTRNEQEETY